MEGWSKREKGLMDMDTSVVIVREVGISGLNGNGKYKKKEKCFNAISL